MKQHHSFTAFWALCLRISYTKPNCCYCGTWVHDSVRNLATDRALVWC